jgi:predicted lipid-binding transport protein (Tim44 family)
LAREDQRQHGIKNTIPRIPPPKASSADQPVVDSATGKASTPPAASAEIISIPDKISRSRQLFLAGKVRAAREILTQAWDFKEADLALELARTYDPNYINRAPHPDAEANPDMATMFYDIANTLGSRAASSDIQRLKEALANRSDK